MSSLRYPAARRSSCVDEYQSKEKGEVTVADPYRWLEDTDDPETIAFVEAQNKVFQQYIYQYGGHDSMRQAIAEVASVPRLGNPHQVGNDLYHTHSLDTPQPILYRKPPVGDGPGLGSLFMDMNKLSEAGTSSVQTMAFSKEGSFFAYGVSDGGSDWMTIFVKSMHTTNLATQPDAAFADGTRLTDNVEDVKWSTIQWSLTEEGFYYQRFPRTDSASCPDRDSAIYFHYLGTPQANDKLVHQDKEAPFKQYIHEISDDGCWLVVTETLHGALMNHVVFIPVEDDQVGNKTYVQASLDGDSNLKYICNVGGVFYFSTTWSAPRGRLMAYNMKEQLWIEHLAEDSQMLLRAVHAYGERFLLVVYTRDVKDELWIFDLETGHRLGQVGEDIIGSVQVKQTSCRRFQPELFIKITSFLAPDTIYAIRRDQIRLHARSRTSAFDPSRYITKQDFFSSKDGTRIPMFLTHQTDYAGGGPVLLYGYGGFNVSVVPSYNPAFISFLRGFGGAVACVNLRGGGEYGEEWHHAGMLEKKQNVLDDFHHAAMHLVQQGLTTHDRIIAMGGSNGGLVVAACVNQRPELYGCVLAKVAVLDCLRYTVSAAGSLGISEIGDPNDPSAFDYLRAYSPLHNVRSGATKADEDNADVKRSPYPPMLLFTADHDNRVPPMHSLKFTAEVQYRNASSVNPIMLRVDTEAGHGAGKSLTKLIHELCDQWAFVSIAKKLSWSA